MYREIAGTDERVRAMPGVRNRRVRATKVRLYSESQGRLRYTILGFMRVRVDLSKTGEFYHISPKYLDKGNNVRVFVRVRIDHSKTERSFTICSQNI